MSQARRTLRVPESIRGRERGEEDDPLWYTGGLQAENGRDVEVTPLPPELAKELRDTPMAVELSGEHPDKALSDSDFRKRSS